MQFTSPLLKGKLVARRKRFFADIVLDDGREITAHCANPGAMLGVNHPGMTVWVSASDNPKRTLPFTLELGEDRGALLGLNTQHPNKLVGDALRAGLLAPFAGYDRFRAEVKYGHENSRIDWLLEADGLPPCYLEVKNVHLRRETDHAEFPDCVTTRGAKHMRELARLAEEGVRAAVLFTVQREDCRAFRPAADIDPGYAEALRTAAEAGVEVYAYACRVSPGEITLACPLPVTLT